ncbi:autoinducer binding domain-containing protein [Rhizobium sp. 18065]|uniref:autoinducer binding domain-containing protein n=1 Tax=Rhizobium sp. 18065 TaxID=2681411 RepID=UPI00135CEAAB|nr:autoinducer binding domain-containing protein [Rhizobium sp. 18065]
MSSWLQSIIDRVAITKNPDQLSEELAQVVQQAGFEYFTYMHSSSHGANFVTNTPPDWQTLYFDITASCVDPMIALARGRMSVFSWDIPTLRQIASRSARLLLDDAHRRGMRFGLTIPIETGFGHIAVLILTSANQAISLKPVDEVKAATVVALLYARYQDRPAIGHDREPVSLMPMQAVCLRWSAEGKTMRDAAMLEGLSLSTVAFHLTNARRTLGAASIAQAIAIATRLQLI